MNNVIEVDGSEARPSAKINLTVDLAYEDCYTMCLELFNNLNSKEQKNIVDNYFIKQQEKIDKKRKEDSI